MRTNLFSTTNGYGMQISLSWLAFPSNIHIDTECKIIHCPFEWRYSPVVHIAIGRLMRWFFFSSILPLFTFHHFSNEISRGTPSNLYENTVCSNNALWFANQNHKSHIAQKNPTRQNRTKEKKNNHLIMWKRERLNILN